MCISPRLRCWDRVVHKKLVQLHTDVEAACEAAKARRAKHIKNNPTKQSMET